MRKAVLLFTILFCCILNALVQEQVEAEEYEICKAWLENAFITPETKQIILMKFTADYHDGFDFLPSEKKRQLSQLQSSTLKSYKLRNRKSVELKNNFGVNPIVNLISKDLPDFMNDRCYEDFAEKFGAKFRIAFSRVGFNKKKNQALIHVQYKPNSNSKYAAGNYFLLSKEDGNWVIKQRVQSWVY